MKIFEFDYGSGKDWVVASSEADAKVYHHQMTGLDDWDMEDVEINIIPENKWEDYHVLDLEYSDDEAPKKLYSFAEAVRNGETGIIATTNY